MGEIKLSEEQKNYIKSLEDKHGRLTPDLLIEDAKNPSSPIHECFEWDVNKAAREHWLDTARELIRTVRYLVTNEHRTFEAPYFVRDPDAKPNEQGYRSIPALKRDKDRAKAVVVSELKRAIACLQRAQDVSEALGYENKIERLIAKIERWIVDLVG